MRNMKTDMTLSAIRVSVCVFSAENVQGCSDVSRPVPILVLVPNKT